MTSAINLIIDGKRISLADYLRMLEEKEKAKRVQSLGQQAGLEFRERAKETTTWIRPRNVKHYFKPEVEMNGSSKVISSRYYTPTEIKEEEERLMKGSLEIQNSIIKLLLEKPNQWFSPKLVFTSLGIPEEKHGSSRFLLSNVTQFLEANNILEVRPNPERKGQVFLVPGGIVNYKDEEIMGKIYHRFHEWLKAKSKEYRDKRKGERKEKLHDLLKPVEEKSDLAAESVKTEQRVESEIQMPASNQEETTLKNETHTDTSSEEWSLKDLPGKLSSIVRESLKIEPGTLTVKVQIDVRFGLLKD